MGDVEATKTLLVTGAGGFIGRNVVAAARARGHKVRAVVRRPDSVRAEWAQDAGITPVVLDLAKGGAELVAAVDGCDSIVHAAAAMTGTPARQTRDTVDATRMVFNAAAKVARVPRIVLISSITVYASDAEGQGGLIDEQSVIEQNPKGRDLYCQNKLLQEEVASDLAKRLNLELCVLRPGAVFGPDHLWNGHIGIRLGPVLLRLGSSGQIPVCYVKNCAEAIVNASVSPKVTELTTPVNMIDSKLPDRVVFLRALGSAGPRVTVPVPWGWIMALAQFLAPAQGVSGRLPGLLRPAILRARMMPVRYDNTRMRALMGDTPMIPFDQAMRSCLDQKATTSD